MARNLLKHHHPHRNRKGLAMFDQRSKRARAATQAKHSRNHRDEEATGLAGEVSSRRRDILKAAATAAPLVATLPSGEALAGASAMQCAINQQEVDLGFPEGIVPKTTPPQDSYARVEGRIQVWEITDPDDPGQTIFVKIYRIPDLNGDLVYVYGDNTDLGTTSLPAPGTWFDITGLGQPVQQAPAQFLYVYNANRPIDTQNDVAVNGLVPGGCTIDTTIPAWPGAVSGPKSPQHCFYPMAIQAPAKTSGNLALTHSCLTSFNNAP
jgi:hypothetical protein